MAGAACAEWHLHAWDLARSLGAEYRPEDPAAVLAGWRAGMPHLPVPVTPLGAGLCATPTPGMLCLRHQAGWQPAADLAARPGRWPGGLPGCAASGGNNG